MMQLTNRDERRNEAYRTQLARADRAEAEVARLNDELIHVREVAELAEKDRRTYHRDALRAEAEVESWQDWSNRVAEKMPPDYDGDDAQEAIIERWVDDLQGQKDRAEAELAELRDMVDRVRALINDPEAASLRHHVNGDFTWVIEITALNAVL